MLTEAEAQAARAVLKELHIEIQYDDSELERAFEMACDYDQPRCYDTAYAAFAEAHGVEMVTTDAAFFAAVNRPDNPKQVPPLSFVKLLK